MKTHMNGVTGVAVAILAGAAIAQPVQWRLEDGGNGHWYELVRTAATWDAAEAAANAAGGHLASITSIAENQFVAAVAAGSGAWLGGLQPVGSCEPGCGWKWNTDEPWSVSLWDCTEPNQGWGAENEDRVCFSVNCTRTLWNDSPGHVLKAAVIEWDADCNHDGIVDFGQFLSGHLPDANHNGIPDSSITITTQPIDQTASVGSMVAFRVEVQNSSTCTAAPIFHWQRRNPLVADPQAAGAWIDLTDGRDFVNADTSSLGISNPQPGLATGYRCRITGGCGCEPLYTNTVNFSVACPADFNADGGIDFSDVEAFFERWENGC
jgi:Lectin C-type domain